MDRVSDGQDAHDPRDEPRPVPLRRSLPRGRTAALVAILLYLGITAGLLLSGRHHLQEAEQLLPTAREAVAAADLAMASDLVGDAEAHLSTASARLENPMLAPLGSVPTLGTDLRAVQTIAARAADVAAVSAGLVEELERSPGGLASLAPTDGAIPVGRFQELSTHLRAVADASATALADIAAAAPSGRIEQVAAAHARVLEELEPLASQVRATAELTEQLPRFLGVEGVRTYLFGASTPAELRGTGGFVGSIALLKVEDGRLDFGTFEASSDLPRFAPTDLPPPVEEDARRWRRYGGTGFFVNLNRTADFPSAANAMLRHWEATHGTALDGMIVADPFALEALLELSGPAPVPGYDVTLDSDSVVPFVTNEAYAQFDDPDARKAILGAVSAGALAGFLTGDVDASPTRVLETFGELVAGGHLLVYSPDEAIQGVFEQARVAGALGDPSVSDTGDLVNVALNSGTASKVDYYAQRELELETTLLADGAARSELVVRVSNHAPTDGITRYVIGPNNPQLEAGDNLVDISVYLSPRAQFAEVPPPADGPSFTETALGHPVHDGWVRIPSGETVERRYAWTTRDAWEPTEDGEVSYRVVVQGQTVIRPTRVSVRIMVPAGFEVVDLPPSAELEADHIVLSGEIRGDTVPLSVRMRPAHEDS
jgi:hypothetical protein